MSQLHRIRPLLLVAALLALAPASAYATNGGASADAAGAPAASMRVSGGAAPGAVARAPARPKARSRPRSRRRPRPRVKPVAAAAPPPTAPATLLPDGTAAAPAGAPAAVVAAIAAGNRIASLPYKWGGGHASWEDIGYDCSGSVGYALHGGGLLETTMTSGEMMAYGDQGPGTWITLYANADHVYMVVAGLRFDTSGAHPSRWQATTRSASGYTVRHPPGL